LILPFKKIPRTSTVQARVEYNKKRYFMIFLSVTTGRNYRNLLNTSAEEEWRLRKYTKAQK